MDVAERKAFNRAKFDEREQAFGVIFGWTPDDAFSLYWLSPDELECDCDSGGSAMGGGLAVLIMSPGFLLDGRPEALVSQPYAPAFEYSKRERPSPTGWRALGVQAVRTRPAARLVLRRQYRRPNCARPVDVALTAAFAAGGAGRWGRWGHGGTPWVHPHWTQLFSSSSLG